MVVPETVERAKMPDRQRRGKRRKGEQQCKH